MKFSFLLNQLNQRLRKLPWFKEIQIGTDNEGHYFCVCLKNFEVFFYDHKKAANEKQPFIISLRAGGQEPDKLSPLKLAQLNIIKKTVESIARQTEKIDWDLFTQGGINWENIVGLSDDEFEQIKCIKEYYEVNTKDPQRYVIFLRINKSCNQRCVFCPIDNDQNSFIDFNSLKKIVAKLNLVYPKINKFLIITGGEPTIYKHYSQLLEHIFSYENFEVSVQTNGVLLHEEDIYRPFAQQENLHYFISFHSHIESIYNKISQTHGHYPKVVEGIKNILAKTKNRVALNYVLNKFNAETIEDYLDFIDKNFASIRGLSFNLSPISLSQSKRKDYLVKFSEIMPKIIKALNKVDKTKLKFIGFHGICGFPLCLLKDYPQYLPCNLKERIEEREKAEVCNSCIFKEQCPGLTAEYIEQFGTGELQPFLVDKI